MRTTTTSGIGRRARSSHRDGQAVCACVRSALLGLAFTSLPLSAESLHVTLLNLPNGANRAVILTDGGGLSIPARTILDPQPGSAAASTTLSIPPGFPYRIRAVAFATGRRLPIVLAVGKITNLSVPAGNSASASITLVPTTAATIIPTSSAVSGAATIKAIINDPGDFITEGKPVALWLTSRPQHGNCVGQRRLQPATKGADGRLFATFTVSASQLQAGPYYQFGYYGLDFQTEDEVPLLLSPDLESATQSTARTARSSTLQSDGERIRPGTYRVAIGKDGRLVRTRDR